MSVVVGHSGVKRIDLNDAFEITLATVLSLPHGSAASPDQEVVEALRDLYTAAHGRTVETVIGPIPIAPPVDPFLKSKSWPLNSRSDLLVLARRKSGSRVRAAGVNGVRSGSAHFDLGSDRGKIAKPRRPLLTRRSISPAQPVLTPKGSE